MNNFFKVPNFKDRYSLALLILRIEMGVAFILHGWPKIQNAFSWMPAEAPVPGLLQALAAFAEFGGGIALLLGLLVPLASLGLIATMAVAALVHIQKGDPFVGYTGSYEPATVYLAMSILLFLMGPGRYSLDAKLFGTKS
jgi:putative oxidoreductase